MPAPHEKLNEELWVVRRPVVPLLPLVPIAYRVHAILMLLIQMMPFVQDKTTVTAVASDRLTVKTGKASRQLFPVWLRGFVSVLAAAGPSRSPADGSTLHRWPEVQVTGRCVDAQSIGL